MEPAAPPLTIRPSRLEDASSIIEFNRRLALETEAKVLPIDTLTAGVTTLLRDPRLGRYFVAISSDQIVGQLMLTEEWSDWRNGRILWLQSVYVDVAFRAHGVFRRLLEHVRRVAREEGAIGLRLYVEDHNERARATYGRCGFADGGYRVMEQIPLARSASSNG